MTNVRLGRSYIERARGRVAFLRQMQAAGLHADAVRESQEAVELALKGLLRIVGLDPPKEHDVSKFLTAERKRLPTAVADHLSEIRRISKRLRRERELAFYGGEDFIPSDEYDAEDSSEAIQYAEAIVEWVEAGLKELAST
ncbi:MAG: HEPN domain-containing protein [Candidatus Binatia bacterium]